MAAPLERVKALLAALPREDQEDLTRYLQDILFTPEEAEARHVASLQAETPGGQPITYTFRSEYVKCGKKGCRCQAGEGHGPYTYKYWKEPGSGRLRKQYVGRSTRPGAKGPEARGRNSSAPSNGAPTAPP